MIDFSIKFYKCQVTTENGNIYKFYLAKRNISDARAYVESYLINHNDRYHITANNTIDLIEVSTESYGTEYGYTIIN